MGYEINRFEDGANLDDFKCGICLEILKDPVMVKNCEHIYCHMCLKEWLIKSDETCPEDRKPIDWSDLVEPSRFFRNQYERIKIKCDFVDVGCKEIVALSALADHVDSCQHNRTECPEECGFIGTRNELRSHDCILYLKTLLLSKKETKTDSESIESTKSQIGDLLKSINFNYNLIWQQFKKLSPSEEFNEGTLLQYRFDQGFTESEKELIARIVVNAFLEENSNFYFVSSRIHRALIKRMRQEKYWHVLVGTAFSCYVKYRKYMALSVAGIQVIVFVNENWIFGYM